MYNDASRNVYRSYFISKTIDSSQEPRTKEVILDSLEDTLETPRTKDTCKEARDFKMHTEIHLGMSSTLYCEQNN